MSLAKRERTFRYVEVADSIAALIDRGLLHAGDRLPSLREVAENRNVSLSTVVQAYWVLEDRGLVETRAKSGHFVRSRSPSAVESVSAPPGEPRSDTHAEIVWRLVQAARDADTIPLASAYPGSELLPIRKLNTLLASFARDTNVPSTVFDLPPGRFELRLQVARRLLNAGLAVSPDDVVITAGTAEAIHLSLAASVRPGDLVAIESPASFVIIQRLEMLGLKILELPGHRGAAAMLDVLSKTHTHTPIRACVLMPSFSNPAGTCMPEDIRKDFVRFLNDEEIPLVEDDVCGELFFDARRPAPLKSFDRKNLVMLCSSFSKTLAPGYRVGWAIPGKFRERVEQLKFATSGASPVLPQLAVAEFLRKGGYCRHLEALRRCLAGQAEEAVASILGTFPPGTHIATPRGGTVLWVELPEGLDALLLERLALDGGIAIAPGPVFSANGRQFRNFVRIGFGQVFTGKVQAGLRRLGAIATAMSLARPSDRLAA